MKVMVLGGAVSSSFLISEVLHSVDFDASGVESRVAVADGCTYHNELRVYSQNSIEKNCAVCSRHIQTGIIQK